MTIIIYDNHMTSNKVFDI